MDELFAEFWNIVKEYVPVKERQTVADHAINTLIDSGASDDILFALKACDKHMNQAVTDQLGEDETDDERYDDDDYGYDDD